MARGTSDSIESGDGGGINRRAYVAALSTAATGALAGCQSGTDQETTDTPGDGGGGEDGGDGGATPTETEMQERELGERVPQLDFHYWAGMGDSTEVSETIAPIIQENAKEAIGVTMQIKPKDFLSVLFDRFDDKRKAHMSITTGPNDPIGLQPFAIADAYHIRTAGPSPPPGGHYVNCDATMLVEEMSTAATRERVTELMQELLQVVSEDIPSITLFNRTDFGAYRNDLVEFPVTGRGGVQRTNPPAFLNARTKGDFSISVNTDRTSLQTHNPHLIINNIAKGWWVRYPHSPLLGYDENWRLKKVLAANYETSNEFKTVTFELREDAVFHDGDPITAEDVKWTFEHISANSGQFPSAQPWPYDSIDVIDEHTVEFNFTKNQPHWITQSAATWGIKHSGLWKEAGMEENPTASEIPFPGDEYVGSGPMRLTAFEAGQRLHYAPFEDHWNTPEAAIDLQTFQGQQSMTRAFEQGTMNAFVGMAPSIADQIRGMESATVVPTKGWDVFNISPRDHWGPFQFKELKLALSQAVDRNRMTEIATFGRSDPILYASPTDPSYPWWPENKENMNKIADSPQANPEKARQILKDAGWGWDDAGRLHYPPDADLDPLWPKGKGPRHYPEKWPCIEELGLTPASSGSG